MPEALTWIRSRVLLPVRIEIGTRGLLHGTVIAIIIIMPSLHASESLTHFASRLSSSYMYVAFKIVLSAHALKTQSTKNEDKRSRRLDSTCRSTHGCRRIRPQELKRESSPKDLSVVGH